jgi:uncharacterized protein (TIGR02118 family)
MGDVVKLVFCVRRRDDVPVDEFHRYWRDEHGPLVRSVGETIGVRRYVQSHLLRGEQTDMIRASRGAGEPFDGVAELWFDRATLSREVSEEVLAASIRLLQDEATFIDLGRSVVFFTEEHEVIALED